MLIKCAQQRQRLTMKTKSKRVWKFLHGWVSREEIWTGVGMITGMGMIRSGIGTRVGMRTGFVWIEHGWRNSGMEDRD